MGALTILNNVPASGGELTRHHADEPENTLQALSTGKRINSGADDPAGLAIANGLQANVTALTQSVQNATDGVGMLQVADGALSQITTLLNSAVSWRPRQPPAQSATRSAPLCRPNSVHPERDHQHRSKYHL